MPFVGSSPALWQVDDRNWRLMCSLEYFGQRERFIVPANYQTDFASVPRCFSYIFPAFGRYTKAAILHDWLITDEPSVTSRDKDGLFRRVLREECVGFIMRWLMWTGVRWAALFNPARRAGWLNWRDTPLLLFWSLVGILLVLFPAVVNQFSLWVYNLLEFGATSVKPGEKPTIGAGPKT